MHTRITLAGALVVTLLSSLTFASTNGTINFGSTLGSLTYTYTQTSYSCSFYLGPPGSGYLVPTNYIVETFNNVTYHNTSVQPNINQTIPGYSDTVGSPGPNAGSQDTCPANTSGSSKYQGADYTIYYYGSNAYIYVPGYINPKYQVVSVLYAPPGSKSTATYTNNNLVSSTVTTKNSFVTSNGVDTSDVTSVSISPWKNGSIDMGSTVSSSYKQTSTTADTTAITVETTTSYSQSVPGPVCDYCGIDHDYDQIEVWLNPVQLYTLIGYGNNSGTTTDTVQPNGYGFSSWDTPGVDVYRVFVGELNGDLPVRSSTTAAFSRSWASTANGFTYGTGQGPALTTADQQNILKTDPLWNCTYKSAVSAPLNCPLPASTSLSGNVSSNGTAVTWISGNTFSRLLERAKIVINGVSYTVATVNSATSLTLSSSAGTQTGVAYSAPSRFTLSTNLNFPFTQPSPGGQPAPTTYQWTYSTTNSSGVDAIHQFDVGYSIENKVSAKLFGVSFQKTVKTTWMTTQIYESNNEIKNTNMSIATASITGPACNIISGSCSPVYPPPHAFNPVSCTALSQATAFGQGDNMYIYQDNLFGTFYIEPYGQP